MTRARTLTEPLAIVAAALLIGPVLGGIAAAQPVPPAPVRLTLAEAIERGLAASHRLAELRARHRGARAVLAGRDAADRPQLAALAGYTRTNHVDEFGIPQATGGLRIIYPDIPDNLRARLDFQWPIYTSGRVDALVRAASAELDASGKDLEAARSDLKLELTRAFWAAITSGEAERVVRESLGRLDAHLTDVRNRQAVGLVPPSDVLSVEAQRSRQAMLLIEAENAHELAMADLRRLTGLEPAVPVEIAVDPEEPSEPAPAADALVPLARLARPERQAIERRMDAAAQSAIAAAASSRPIVAIGAGFDYARPNQRIFPRVDEWRTSWDLGVNLTWSLWDGGRVKADVAAATAASEAAAERLKEFDTVLDLEVRQRRLDLDAARAAVAAAGDGVRSAAEARRVLVERFNTGIATSTELLDAQVALLQAELDRTRALANLRLAEARLARALGR